MSRVSIRPRTPRQKPRFHSSVRTVVGRIVGHGSNGCLLVDFPGNPNVGVQTARSVVAPKPGLVGREALLAFDRDDVRRPIVLGVLHDAHPSADAAPVRVDVDGESMTITAAKELVLRCGEASVTLTRAGKVIVRGTYVLSRSSGVNSIKGASVQIN